MPIVSTEEEMPLPFDTMRDTDLGFLPFSFMTVVELESARS